MAYTRNRVAQASVRPHPPLFSASPWFWQTIKIKKRYLMSLRSRVEGIYFRARGVHKWCLHLHDWAVAIKCAIWLPLKTRSFWQIKTRHSDCTRALCTPIFTDSWLPVEKGSLADDGSVPESFYAWDLPLHVARLSTEIRCWPRSTWWWPTRRTSSRDMVSWREIRWMYTYAYCWQRFFVWLSRCRARVILASIVMNGTRMEQRARTVYLVQNLKVASVFTNAVEHD